MTVNIGESEGNGRDMVEKCNHMLAVRRMVLLVLIRMHAKLSTEMH